MSQPTKDDINRYWKNWQDEVDAIAQYEVLANLQSQPQLTKLYQNLAKIEENHASFWEKQLGQTEEKLKPRHPSWRSRVLIWVAKHISPNLVVATMAKEERLNQNMYTTQPETFQTKMTQEERWHAKVLREVLKTHPGAGAGGFFARLESRHHAVGGNALRAAILGANDGLCSNLSLVMGVAGANLQEHTLLLTGIAGMLAGAFSMGLGEWVSVTSARELAQREIRIESEELEANPESEGEELELIYQAKGLSREEAHKLAQQLLQDKPAALDALTREELGIDPEQLGGSPIEAAAASSLLFAAGAFIPVVPFFFPGNRFTVLISVLISALALYAVGTLITIFTGKPAFKSGMRQLILGLIAAGITYGIGKLIGVSLS